MNLKGNDDELEQFAKEKKEKKKKSGINNVESNKKSFQQQACINCKQDKRKNSFMLIIFSLFTYFFIADSYF